MEVFRSSHWAKQALSRFMRDLRKTVFLKCKIQIIIGIKKSFKRNRKRRYYSGLLVINNPAIINNSPKILYAEIGSLKRNAENKRTKTNDKLIKGYAKLNSSFVIAAIQNKDARKAAINPESIKGSQSNPIKKEILWKNSVGNVPYFIIRHFIINCPYTVKNTVQKI